MFISPEPQRSWLAEILILLYFCYTLFKSLVVSEYGTLAGVDACCLYVALFAVREVVL